VAVVPRLELADAAGDLVLEVRRRVAQTENGEGHLQTRGSAPVVVQLVGEDRVGVVDDRHVDRYTGERRAGRRGRSAGLLRGRRRSRAGGRRRDGDGRHRWSIGRRRPDDPLDPAYEVLEAIAHAEGVRGHDPGAQQGPNDRHDEHDEDRSAEQPRAAAAGSAAGGGRHRRAALGWLTGCLVGGCPWIDGRVASDATPEPEGRH
jgi:hypothetical protein